MNNAKNLLKKEWLLNWKPAVYLYIYALLTLTLLAPNYPYLVAFGYCLIGIPTLFSYFRANKDLEFSALLPIPRADIVKSKFYAVLLIQGVQIIAAIPCAFISSLLINTNGNLVGLDANFTLFAVTLIEFSVFNIIFLPMFFKTGYKVAVPTVFAFLGYLITTCAIEILIAVVPILHQTFDGFANIAAQLILLAVGIIIYLVTMLISYKLSVKNFLKVNL